MTVNTELQQEGEGEFPKAQTALAHAGRPVQELQNETGFVGVFSLDGGPIAGLNPDMFDSDRMLEKCPACLFRL